MSVVLGLDLGGSTSRALLLEGDDDVLLEERNGACNPEAVGEAGAAAVLERLLAGMRDHPGPAPAACCCGAAGADGQEARQRMHRLLARLLPGIPIKVVPDPLLVLAAARLERGVAVISGTGSIAYGIAEGRTARAGGWGHRLGDEGSGYWSVREAVRGVLSAHDQGRSLDPAQRELMERAGASDALDLIHRFHNDHEPGRWAALSGLALRDEKLLEGAAEELARLVETVRERLGGKLPVVLAGGVLLNTPMLEAQVRARLSGSVTRLEAAPVLGAALLARALIDR